VELYRRTATTSRVDYGASDYDTRNTAVGFLNYEIPAFKGPKPSQLRLGGQLGIHLQGRAANHHLHGDPTTVEPMRELSAPTKFSNPLAGVSHTIVNPGGGATPYVQWLNPAAYAQPATGTWGSVPRNNVYGPGFEDVDLSVFQEHKSSASMTFRSTYSFALKCTTSSTA